LQAFLQLVFARLTLAVGADFGAESSKLVHAVRKKICFTPALFSRLPTWFLLGNAIQTQLRR